MVKIMNLYTIGDKYGSWEIINHATPYKHGGATRVLVQCVCKSMTRCLLTDLKSGKSTQCTECKKKGRPKNTKIVTKIKGDNTFTAYQSRESGECRKDGLCRRYRVCSGVFFRRECAGFEVDKKYYTNGNDVVIHGGVI